MDYYDNGLEKGPEAAVKAKLKVILLMKV